jgi:hypothetical protein
MSDDDLDLSAYDADVVEHVLVGRARARMLEDVRQGKPWNLDLARGELAIGDTRHKAQILGTFAKQSGTFMWAWANPGSKGWRPSLEIATSLRTRGNTPGYAVLRRPQIASGWVNPNELAFVSGELAGGHPVFVGSYDGGAAFLLVTTLRLEPSALSPAYIPGLLLDLPQITTADPKACIRRFAERLGYAVEDGPEEIRAARAGSGFQVTFDDQGRIAEVNVTAG